MSPGSAPAHTRALAARSAAAGSAPAAPYPCDMAASSQPRVASEATTHASSVSVRPGRDLRQRQTGNGSLVEWRVRAHKATAKACLASYSFRPISKDLAFCLQDLAFTMSGPTMCCSLQPGAYPDTQQGPRACRSRTFFDVCGQADAA